MGTKRLSTASIRTLSKSNKMWDQDTAQGAMVPIGISDMNGTTTAFGFGNIPQTYQDLMIVANLRNVAGNAAAGWIINNNPSGVTYGVTTLRGDGSSATSVRGSSMSYGASQIGILGSTSGINATMIVHFLNYANTTTKKTWIQKTGSDLNGSGFVGIEAFGNNLTDAITSIACSTANGSIFWSGTATLYGIKAGA
jgi:hypothetical protein